ncbi:hypothetical protein C8034_v005989 [Colletotrichum sidae]|uniref:Uncharacterized protein n=1 Tax=Colletotrichum sidae TaxID=1347389 RepID=A0A4V3I1Y8_9PEZI|nr:hypothetical protein C8034_v005989 [Colletotrichum sidae]
MIFATLQKALLLFFLVAIAFRASAEAKKEVSCDRRNTLVAYKYKIRARDVDESRGDLCGKLWENLYRFAGSCIVSAPKCEKTEGNVFVWDFWTPIGCNSGMVHSAWWESVGVKYGDIKCNGYW